MIDASYGFRIEGDCRNDRRLVDAAAALVAYATCDRRANVDCEAYLSAFQFGAEFRAYLERTGSTKGYSGPCWSPWLWFDIDRDDDLPAATESARRLCAALVERYGIDGDDVLVFFSGSKGYHVGLPTSLWQPQPSTEFHRCARAFAEHQAEAAGVAIDCGVYDRVRAFRAPNSRHPKTGRHKRRIGFAELLHTKPTALVERAATPEPFDLPPGPRLNQRAADDWRAAIEHVERQATAAQVRRQAYGSPTLNRATLDFIRDGATAGDRHRLLYSAAANLAEFGCSTELAHALLSEAALDSGLAPAEVRRQVECGLAAPGARCGIAGATNGAADGTRHLNGSHRFTGAVSGPSGQTCQQVTGATE